jgi:hypothetical protein
MHRFSPEGSRLLNSASADKLIARLFYPNQGKVFNPESALVVRESKED